MNRLILLFYAAQAFCKTCRALLFQNKTDRTIKKIKFFSAALRSMPFSPTGRKKIRFYRSCMRCLNGILKSVRSIGRIGRIFLPCRLNRPLLPAIKKKKYTSAHSCALPQGFSNVSPLPKADASSYGTHKYIPLR